MMPRMFTVTIVACFGLSGCAAELSASVPARVEAETYVAPVVVRAPPPPLTFVDDDVAVVVDAPEPVYFVAGAYWRPGPSGWMRARHWHEPWVRVEEEVVPVTIVHRDHARYVHYRVAARAQVFHEGDIVSARAKLRVARKEEQKKPKKPDGRRAPRPRDVD